MASQTCGRSVGNIGLGNNRSLVRSLARPISVQVLVIFIVVGFNPLNSNHCGYDRYVGKQPDLEKKIVPTTGYRYFEEVYHCCCNITYL